MTFVLASRREIMACWALTLALSVCLAGGFLSAAHQVGRWFSLPGSAVMFPALAFLFWVSLPKRKLAYPQRENGLWLTLPLPLFVALVFGFFIPGGLFYEELPPTQTLAVTYLWYGLLAPVGEELLFRGWVYELVESLWPRRWLTATNPLSLSVWASSVSFSLWHLQNLSSQSPAFVLFQVSYTLLAGIWLGYLRDRTGSLWLPLLCHVLINSAANLF